MSFIYNNPKRKKYPLCISALKKIPGEWRGFELRISKEKDFFIAGFWEDDERRGEHFKNENIHKAASDLLNYINKEDNL